MNAPRVAPDPFQRMQLTMLDALGSMREMTVRPMHETDTGWIVAADDARLRLSSDGRSLTFICDEPQLGPAATAGAHWMVLQSRYVN